MCISLFHFKTLNFLFWVMSEFYYHFHLFSFYRYQSWMNTIFMSLCSMTSNLAIVFLKPSATLTLPGVWNQFQNWLHHWFQNLILVIWISNEFGHMSSLDNEVLKAHLQDVQISQVRKIQKWASHDQTCDQQCLHGAIWLFI